MESGQSPDERKSPEEVQDLYQADFLYAYSADHVSELKLDVE